MSKQEEIKQALAAATASHESMHNQNPYFTNKQLEELSEYFKTIPVDEEGHPYEPEYNSMAVRSDVLKMISDVWQARRKQYEVEFERDRLHDENQSLRRSLTSEAVKDANYNVEIVRLRKLVDVGNEAARELEYAKKQAGIWNDEAVRLRKELEGAIKILRFYSQQEHYIDEDPGLYASPAICQDSGSWARSFLVGQEGEGNQ
ncbi:hypothetical protein [Paenibacillus tundrae]